MLGLVICGVERMCCFLIWVAYTHRKLEPGLHLNWFSIDIVGIIIPMALVIPAVYSIDTGSINRQLSKIYVIGVGGLSVFCGFIFSSYLRGALKSRIMGYLRKV